MDALQVRSGSSIPLPRNPWPHCSPAASFCSVILVQPVLLCAAVQCLAGPRCRVTKAARLEPMPASKPDAAAPPPLLHVEFALEEDEPTEDATADAALARDCLERLCKLAPLDREPSARANLPPLLCPERLSFWLCQLLLRNDDTERRRAMLTKRSTYERLCFVSDLIDRASNRPSEGESP